MNIVIKAPATSANLGVLFDKGGAALTIFRNTIEVGESDRFQLVVEGEGREELPGDENNLVFRAIDHFYMSVGRRPKKMKIMTHNRIPLSRGLGSSAACIAGGMTAANIMEGELLSEAEIIHMASAFEGHGDNICACVKGGVCIYENGRCLGIPGVDAGFIIYVPAFHLETRKSRAALPETYAPGTMEKAAALEKEMIVALSAGDLEKAGMLMEKDVLHQPYRKKMRPFWDDVSRAARNAGAYGTALSGAGPSMISLCPRERLGEISAKIRSSIDKKHDLSIMLSEIDENGIETEVLK
jgi:homoserine kinase